jgi:pyruvate dehydrogenase E2 component (dihydrolipoamide acetyltransferase)
MAETATHEIRIPDIGDVDEVQVVEICVQPGDEIGVGDALIVIESDKASMEVPAEIGGTVDAILVAVGDTVAQGHPVASVVALDSAAPKTAPFADAEVVVEVDAEASRNDVGPVPGPAAEAVPDAAASAADKSSASFEVLEIRVPDIGEATDVVVIEVAVQAGQEVSAEDLLVVVESDKASMEIPAGHGGTVAEVHVAEGVNVVQGTLLVTLESSASGQPAAPQADVADRVAESVGAPESVGQPEIVAEAVPSPASGIYAGPAVRRLARELGVDLRSVAGTGSRGRIVKDDVKEFVKTKMLKAPEAASAIPRIPAVDFAKFGATENRALTRIQAVGARNLHRSWLNVPHVTQHDEADVTELELFRRTLKEEATRRGVKITPLAFIVKACCYALKEFATFNSSLDEQAKNYILKHYYHIGFAVDTPEGLLVPVLRDADKKGVWELSAEISELAEKARAQKLSMGDLQGGSFSVSSLGAIGGTAFTPLINAPEVAILGVARLATRPVWDGEGFVPRQMLPLSLSYDHRAINGAEAGRFVSHLTDLLGDIRRLSL